MDIQNARYNENGDISAIVDSVSMIIPAVAGNRYYDDIVFQDITPTAWVLSLESAKIIACNKVNDLRDLKRNLPILTEGYVVQTGALNVGAMATDMFAASKNQLIVDTLISDGNVATLAFTKPHHQKTGCSFPVSGADQTEYNITAVVTPISPHALTYPISGPVVSPATGTIVVGLPTFKWIDDDNNVVYWTEDEAEEIVQACTEYLDECTLHGVELKNEIRDCTTVAEVEAIDITTGWPGTGL